MTVRLIAVDLDGTLLDPWDRVTRRTIAAVARARACGLLVVPVTGRPDRLVWDVAAEAGLGPLGVCANGAILIDLDHHEVITSRGFTGREAVTLVDLIRATVPGVALAADTGDQLAHEPSVLEGLDLAPRRGRLLIEDVRDRVAAHGCLKFIARRADLSSLELAAWLSPALRAGGRSEHTGEQPEDGGGWQPDGDRSGEGGGRPGESGDRARRSSLAAEAAGMDRAAPGDMAEVTASEIAWVDIGPAGLTKATGLSDMCERLGLALDEVAAIGDHYNDLPMLRAAGWAGAMGNGVAEVLDVADVVMPSNADDGAAAFIDTVVDALHR